MLLTIASGAVLDRSMVLKACASLVVFLLLSTIYAGPADDELRSRASVLLGVFSPPVMVNDVKSNDQVVPVIVATPDDRLVVVWQDSRLVAECPDIFVSTSNDNGTTFSKNKRADDSVEASNQLEPAVAVAGNGALLVAWQDNRRLVVDYDIYFAKSYDGGNTFTRNVRVDDPTEGISWQERPSIAVTAGGLIYIAWTDDRGGIVRVRGAYSTDFGETFSPSAEIVPDGSTCGQTGISLAANGNRIFAAFMDNVSGVPHPYLCVSTNGGKSFFAPVRLDNVDGLAVSQRGITIAPMPGGGVVAVWEDSRNGNWDIYASIASVNGKIVTSGIRVDDDSTDASQLNPCVASDQLGNIFVTWADERDSLYAVRFSYLIAGESQFNASMDVSTPTPNNMQRRPWVIATEPGRAFVTWQDDKAATSGTYDVYVSGIYLPNLFGLSLTDGWNLVSIPSVDHGYKASTLGLKTGDIVSHWNSTTQIYDKLFVVGVSPSAADFEIDASTGYWIYTRDQERLHLKGIVPTAQQSRHVAVPSRGGWALVGFESLNVTRYASDVPSMVDVTGAISIVGAWDQSTGAYKLYVIGFPQSDFVLVPGQAYWCYFVKSGTMTYVP